MYLVVYVMKIIKEIKLPYIYISIKDRSLQGKLVILLFLVFPKAIIKKE